MIVLDTHAWIWWIGEPRRLSGRARRAIQREEKREGLLVSVVSAWEVALKHGLGKLRLNQDVRTWIVRAARYPGIRMVPIELDEAVDSVQLPGEFHRDPADRFIVALARKLDAAVVTSDERILAYRHVASIW